MMMRDLTLRNRQALARHFFRRAQQLYGHVAPDPRDEELRQRGRKLQQRIDAQRREYELDLRGRIRAVDVVDDGDLPAFLRPQAG